MKLTIVTPTYNRGYIIEKVYRSLQAQTCNDFEWLVVDDGSSDDTDELFRRICDEENSFNINYTKRPRQGLNRALNYAVNIVTSDYLFKLDSDDYLMPDAVEKMLKWIEDIDDDNEIVGVGIARCFPNGEYLKGVPPIVNAEGYVDATNLERDKYHLDADMSEAYKVNVLKKFPYPVWDSEIYAPEGLGLNEIALAGYKVRWYAEKLYVCEYLPGGITKGSRLLEKKNPMGFAMMYNHILKYEYPFRKSYYAACQHIALSLVGGEPAYILKSNSRFTTFCALPIGIALSIRRLFQFRNLK